VFALPWAKISRRSHHPALRYPQPYKQTKNKKSKLNITPNATLWRDKNRNGLLPMQYVFLTRSRACCKKCVTWLCLVTYFLHPVLELSKTRIAWARDRFYIYRLQMDAIFPVLSNCDINNVVWWVVWCGVQRVWLCALSYWWCSVMCI